MAEFVYIQNYAKRGNLAISTNVFDEIISIAINKIKGVKLKSSDKFIFSLKKTLFHFFQKNI